MKGAYLNRLNMFKTTLGTLNSPEHKPVWTNQPPQIFAAKVAALITAVANLEAVAGQHETPLTGTAEQKSREEKELAAEVFGLGQALTSWFLDQHDETNAAKVNLKQSAWRRLRDQQLLDRKSTRLNSSHERLSRMPSSA